MTGPDKVLHEFLSAAGGDMRSALYRMASTIDMARCRTEDVLPDKGMGGHTLALLWRDLHPNTRPTGGSDG